MFLKTKSGEKIELPSDEDDAIIKQQAIEDDTLHTDAELNEFKPISAFKELDAIVKKSRGRPKQDTTKISTTIRLDPEVIDQFKAKGRGWQTMINDALKDWLADHRA